ncbi:cholesterol 7-desaturase nvd-like isoform X2 [Asterias amurensis]|uniref:cholesterol 7-desaturase nvd-like isoform X2 n=1 Tax=Asterias amurensis TaxID=7602 RepID=UPI003AB58851
MATVLSSLMLLIAAVVVAIGVYGPTQIYQDFFTTFRTATESPLFTSLLNTGLGYINITSLLAFSLLSGLIYATRLAYNFLFNPMEHYGSEAETAYNIIKPSPGKTTEERMREMKQRRDIGDIPPVYPNGWFVVIRSDELKKGETKCVNVLGMNLAAFRGESGRSYIVDAYCPHLGANLGMGGKVEGDCIACPFHGWTFRGDDGKCVKIHYAEKVPAFAKVKTHRSLEINHLIMLWYHAEGDEPSWFPPEFEEVKTGQYTYQGFSAVFYDCHIQDVAENHADKAHFNVLHASKDPCIGFDFNLKCEFSEERKHVNVVSTTAVRKNEPLNKWMLEEIGPGLSYYFDETQRARFLVSSTPVGPMRQRTMAVGYSGTGIIDRIKTKIAIKASADVLVWANKTYRPTPLFVKEDQLIKEHRRWFAQFYTKNSPRYNPNASLEW